ncbi:MAG TPA: GntR family transcriptional regulator [Planctomycetota bacterium]|nr:GntR family transcriptional regulator [Planctomycetota bacterium]
MMTDLIRAIPKYAQLRDLLAEEIVGEEYGPHAALPTQRTLMARYRLSFSTVKRALDELMAMGLAYSKPGKGIYVADPSRASVERQLVFTLCGVTVDLLSTVPHEGWLGGLLRAQHAVNFLLEPLESSGYAAMVQRLRRGTERTDGAVFMGLADREGLRKVMEETGFRYVAIDVPVRRDDLNAVICDHEEGAFEVVSHLIRRGYERIAFVGQTPGVGSDHAWANAKHAGYLRALAAAGLEVHDEDVMFIDNFVRQESAAWAEEAVRRVVRPGVGEVTAVFASIQSVAAALLRQLEERGVDVPGELAVAGFNDREHVAGGQRKLTTVRIPMEEAAEEAVRMLVAQIRGEEPYPQQRVLNGRLVVRESTVRSAF